MSRVPPHYEQVSCECGRKIAANNLRRHWRTTCVVRQKRKADLERFAAWKHPEGTPVIVRRDDGSEFATRTRSMPWDLCGTPVVLLEGISGGYALERVRSAPAPPAAGDASLVDGVDTSITRVSFQASAQVRVSDNGVTRFRSSMVTVEAEGSPELVGAAIGAAASLLRGRS